MNEEERRQRIRELLDELEGTLHTAESGDEIVKRIRKEP